MASSFNLADNLLPIKTVYNGTACAFCEKSSPDLVACSACKHARYCNKDCQTADWKGANGQHKCVCKMLKAFRYLHGRVPPPPGKAGALALIQQYNNNVSSLEREAKLSPGSPKAKFIRQVAQNYLGGCRICSVCRRTEYDVPAGEARNWPRCTVCNFGWCCSGEHWNQYRADHTEAVCEMYREAIGAAKFRNNHIRTYHETFIEMPRKVLSEPMLIFPRDWDEYYRVRCPDSWEVRDRLPKEYFPEGTRELSQPVNCLHGMYLHGADHFQKLATLTVHIVGAGPSYEWQPTPTMIWEEILHCLPSVKTLNVIFVGPELDNVMSPPTIYFPPTEIGCCPDCIAKGRKRTMGTYAKTWHEYRADSEHYLKPDLIVAFNTGIHEEDTLSWASSIGVMLDDDIPCLFTSYNETEARKDFEVLESLGAHILTEKAQLNPFPVDVAEIDAGESKADQFYKANQCYVCFRGRTP